MDQKAIIFICIAVAVGLAGGAGIGYAAFHEDAADPLEQQTYWFYLDYGAAADEDHRNGWVSVTGTSTADAVKKIPGISCSERAYGLSIDSINGIAGSTEAPYVYWAQYIRNGAWSQEATPFEQNWTMSNFGISGTYCTCMYLAYGDGSAPTDDGWITTGPFATA